MSAWYDQLYIPDPNVIKVMETAIAATEPCPDWAQECRECDWDSSATECQNLGATAGDVGGCMPTNWMDYYHYGGAGLAGPCNPDGTRDLHHVLISGVSATCFEHPCAPGQSCDYRSYSTFCSPCPENTVSADGITCSVCAAGMGANAEQTACEPCTGNQASAFGICQDCGENTLPDASKISCIKCPAGETPRSGVCECSAGRYDSDFGLVFCFVADYFDDRLQSDDMTVTRVEQSQGQRCLPCPDECLSCEGLGREPRIKSGYALSPSSAGIFETSLRTDTTDQTGDSTQLARSLFLCPMDGEVCGNHSNSASEEIGARRHMQDLDNSLVECAPGHGGVLCGTCLEGWTGSFNKPCTPCPEQSGLVGLSIILIVGAVLVVLLFRCCINAEASLEAQLREARTKLAMARKAAKTVRHIKEEMSDQANADEGTAFQSLQETVR